MKKNRQAGFTLIEILIAFSVLIIFVGIAHQIFVGGSKTAGKARWLDGITTELRITTNMLSQGLKNTSYPTTLKSDAVKDAGSNAITSALRTKWYVKVPRKTGTERIAAATPGSSAPVRIMTWYVCESEHPENSAKPQGKVIKYQMTLESHDYSKGTVGDVYLLKTEKQFTTPGPNYAEGNAVAEPSDTDSPLRTKILTDVVSFKFILTQDPPIHDPSPIKIQISCRSMQDSTTHKELDLLVTPNVGITELP